MKSTGFWVILIAGLLVVSGVFAVLVARQTSGTMVNIYLDGKCIRSIDLSQADSSYEFTVDGPAGSNTIQVEPGRICVSRADCPDQICVHQGWISTSVIPIVCLPNRLVILIEEQTGQNELDGVAG